MEFLELDEIRINTNEIFNAYELLLERIPGIRRKSKQWQFLDLCFRRTVLSESTVMQNLKANANYYKYEVQNILERHYNIGFQELKYVFTLMHARDVGQLGLYLKEDNYPSTFDYFLLVRSLKPEERPSPDVASVKEYLLKVVYEGIKAEFGAYKELPEINEHKLLTWFNQSGSAFNEIMSTLTGLQNRNWVLTNLYNPSHHLIKSMKLAEFDNNHALIRTVEYYYLKWFDQNENGYTYVYRETNTQTYQLINKDGIWLIEANLRNLPLTSLPRRQATYKKR
ncbi:MAG: hypothetical protein MJE63_26455 [Proteobacteria bacterium]|nr:hypothetical protein [Pseudomonadota bacterium]